mgnify:CR=1 FL=1
MGEGNPSGKLVDTFARALEDYPSTYNFHDSERFVDYTDDIYVGYYLYKPLLFSAKLWEPLVQLSFLELVLFGTVLLHRHGLLL